MLTYRYRLGRTYNPLAGSRILHLLRTQNQLLHQVDTSNVIELPKR